MIASRKNNYAFIDSQNLNLSVRSLGWKLNFGSFRVYLREKYSIQQAYLFIGYLPGNQHLYTALQMAGYICVFKPTLELPDGTVKGNVDAELVLHTMIQYNNFDKALLVSGDGDFFCLAQYLLEQDKLLKVLIPNQARYSGLLKRLSTQQNNVFDFISELRVRLEYRPK
ncbi:MAG: NYN domain-containing protein [Candidatus Magasanikbacteria bacterium]|nr:NYN domain-containing protein [Candidatus Magasanikbacteria bacterium]